MNHNYWALVPGPCAPQWAGEVGTAMRSPYTATEWPPLATAGDLAQQQRLSSAKNKYINPKQNNIKMPHNCSLKCQSFIHLYSKTLTFSGVMMFVALIILHRSWCWMIFPNTQLSLNRVFFSSLVMTPLWVIRLRGPAWDLAADFINEINDHLTQSSWVDLGRGSEKFSGFHSQHP